MISKKSSQGVDFDSNVDQVSEQIIYDGHLLKFFENNRESIRPKFSLLPTGSNKPDGWLFEIMQNDLQKGMVGALDKLYPGINNDDLFHSTRRGGLEDVPEMGDLVLVGDAWETSIMWWNAETAGNWWDGFVRHAFLTDDLDAIEKSRKLIENLIISQDDDGYIGIYKENLRYQHEGSNGELWAQTTAFRTMLAYYELSGEKQVLEAVEKALALTIKKYGEEGRNPFYLKNEFGGATHGLMMTDVCETLFRITRKQEYQDYAVFLYKAYSTYGINRAFNDIRYPYLIDREALYEGHGVHTYENLRSLLNAYYATGYSELKEAWENALYKLEFCILPSGAGHGNEFILGMPADPTYTSTEMCTMLELRNFYGSALQKTGDIHFADQAEKLTFNGIMGFRNEPGTALNYGKGDNCYILDGKHYDKDMSKNDPRYKYSPTHSEPAVCCVPNYGRNFTYYLDNMWMKTEDGIATVLYGPCTLQTKINNVGVTIKQITNFPFSDEVKLTIACEKPVEFSLHLREPGWSENAEVSLDGKNHDPENGYFSIRRKWTGNDNVLVNLRSKVQLRTFRNREIYFERGALIYALEIPHTVKKIKTYDDEKFFDYYSFPESRENTPRIITEEEMQSFEHKNELNGDEKNIWYAKKDYLEGRLIGEHGEENVKLVPMGCTELRQVSFRIGDIN